MRLALQTFRLFLQIGWLLPLALLTGSGLHATLGSTVSLWLLAGVGVLELIIFGALSERLAAHESRRALVGQVAGLTLLAVILAFFVTNGTGFLQAVGHALANQDASLIGISSFWIFFYNFLFFLCLSGLVVRIVSTETTYPTVLRDMRTGLACIVLVLIIAAFEKSRLTVGTGVYLAAIGYVLLGVLGVALARRYAFEDTMRDKRATGIEPEWALTTLLMIGLLSLVAVILVQIFAYDFVGAFGHITSPFRDTFARAVGWFGGLFVGVAEWIKNLLGIHHPHHHAAPKHHKKGFRFPKPKKIPPRHPHSEGNPIVEGIIKVLIICGVGAAVLLFLSLGAKIALRRRRGAMLGARRASSWSWAGMINWFLRRTKEELMGALPHPHLPRSRRIRSVRDAYRAFLRFGHAHARPRRISETGPEYSADLQPRWPGSESPLQGLNDLWLRERYGASPGDSDAVRQAARHLEEIEAAARAREKATSRDP